MPFLRVYFFVGLVFMVLGAKAQYKVKGTVYDSSRTYPLEAVSVIATNGRGVVTNSAGAYIIEVSDADSIQFSYLGKPTVKFPVKNIINLQQFDIALRVPVTMLKEVRIQPRNYRQDSLQNRRDYEKIFNFSKPNLGSMTSVGPMGAGIDVNELIRAFQFRKNRNLLRFQQRLLQQEQDKYIDYRFSKAVVRRLTGFEGDELTNYMNLYRPDYELVIQSSDYALGEYIKRTAASFKKQKGF